MVISVADASTWLSICYQWVIENIYFIAFLTLYPQECSILPIFTSRFETDPKKGAKLHDPECYLALANLLAMGRYRKPDFNKARAYVEAARKYVAPDDEGTLEKIDRTDRMLAFMGNNNG